MSYIPSADMFNVTSRAQFMEVNGQKIVMPYKGLAVTDKDGHTFGLKRAVSESFEIHQPSEVLAQFEKVADDQGLTIQKVMTNPAKAAMMISAKYDNLKIAGESHDVSLVFYTTHDGSRATFLTLQALRMACMNQIPVLYKGKDSHIITEKHYANSLDIEMLGAKLAAIPESVTMYNARCEQLSDQKMSKKDFIDFMIAHTKSKTEAKQFANKRALWESAYGHNDNKAIKSGTAYKALHAITWLNTHAGRDTKYKAENVILKGRDDSEKAFRALLAA